MIDNSHIRDVLITNNLKNGDNGDFDNERNNNSMRRLLNSHLSIYNTLNNPDLDVSPNFRTESRFPTPEFNGGSKVFGGLGDSSWQSISNDSILDHKSIRTLSNSPMNQYLNRPASLLSLSDEEDIGATNGDDNHQESMVILDKIASPMVFETDEEGDDFDLNRIISHNVNDTFIMPKMSVNQSFRPFQITLLSSCESDDINQLAQYVKSDLYDHNIINVNHFDLRDTTGINEDAVKKSDLIFIVNDGSFIFVEYLARIFNNNDYNSAPKLTLINMITVNYFINLFELINKYQPYQIWKASSLKQQTLLEKFKSFVKLELDNHIVDSSIIGSSVADSSIVDSNVVDDCFDKTTNHNNLNLTLTNNNNGRPSMEKSSSVYSSLTSNKRPNYKLLERQIKSELLNNSSFVIDPLHLSKNFSFIRGLYSIANALVKSDDNHSYNKLYVLGSFALGISLGVSIASGSTTVFAVYLSNVFSKVVPYFTNYTYATSTTPSSPPTPTNESSLFDFNKFSPTLNMYFQNFCSEVKSTELFQNLCHQVVSALNSLRLSSSYLVNSVCGGLEKLVGIAIYSLH